jgi:ectoine hydroxylase-related dioxygenase (phytanoyl-CoA dioxygenase family)
MKYTVNGLTQEYTVAGARCWGNNIKLLDGAVDLTQNTPWHETGYTVEKLFEDDCYTDFKKNTHNLLIDLWQNAGLNLKSDFELCHYHTVAKEKETHLAAVEKTKLLDVSQFPIPIQELEQRISVLCNDKLMVKNPFDNQTIFHFRVIRPHQTDNNPLHRDVWLEDYKDCINLYIPIAGSNEKSSLVIAEGSHLWPESKVERTISGAVVNNVKYNVPAVTAIKDVYQLVRPNPKPNEVLIFSPYLIHGGSANFNLDQTRISIEVRLWKFN